MLGWIPSTRGSTAQRGLVKETFLHLGGRSSSSMTASICAAEASSSETLNRHLLHIVDGAVTLWNTEPPFSASIQRSQSAAGTTLYFNGETLRLYKYLKHINITSINHSKSPRQLRHLTLQHAEPKWQKLPLTLKATFTEVTSKISLI